MDYNEILDYLKKNKLQNKINKLAQKYKNKKILIYGAGLFFNVVKENFDLSKLNIVAITDKKFKKEEIFENIKAIPFSKINDLNFDIIIIATLEPEIIESYLKKSFWSKYSKLKIDKFNNYTFKDFLCEIIAHFS